MIGEIAETEKKKVAEKLRGESIFVIADESEYKSIKFVNVMDGSLSNLEKSYLVAMKHVTCLAHLMHNCAERVRIFSCYRQFDFIS